MNILIILTFGVAMIFLLKMIISRLDRDKTAFIDSLLDKKQITISDGVVYFDANLNPESISKLKAISSTEEWITDIDSEIGLDKYLTLRKYLSEFPQLNNDLPKEQTVKQSDFTRISDKYRDLVKRSLRNNLVENTEA